MYMNLHANDRWSALSRATSTYAWGVLLATRNIQITCSQFSECVYVRHIIGQFGKYQCQPEGHSWRELHTFTNTLDQDAAESTLSYNKAYIFAAHNHLNWFEMWTISTITVCDAGMEHIRRERERERIHG